jgi:hypothetical protein
MKAHRFDITGARPCCRMAPAFYRSSVDPTSVHSLL